MVVKHHVEGYDNFFKFMESIENQQSNKPIIVLFSGSKLPSGRSWCPDCVDAEPFIEKGLKAAPESAPFIYVEVGDRAFWKDPKCPFRTNPKTKLNVLPTLSLWGTQKRLEGDQCLNIELIEMMVTDDDD
ncbi:thioredoxin domain-containing protein 17-like [Chelonus insularis]|uniref:thioredoxin domain-containing protein 17-like n=1 Tax=Chelonus insularis TaxID=460826 RepID=UPI0015884598|nr:thioredoxin domain-containing protein 17-like [Chelonus insularis]